MTRDPLLQIDGVVTGYDRVDVLHDVHLQAREGDITCLLGANGAGKSTLIKAIFGLLPLRSGTVRFAGEDLGRLQTHEIVRLGIAAIPEGNRVFPRMSVVENLRVGAYLETSTIRIADRLEQVFTLFPRLQERATQYAGTLSGGERSMLSIGRSLMGRPRLLVIDEPSLGLSPRFVQENFRIIQGLRSADCSILLVEQNARQTLAIAQHGYVMSQGRIVLSGAAPELRDSPAVAQAYFGVVAA
jgi:branched-chain amino acid transport system ATP-binding protein